MKHCKVWGTTEEIVSTSAFEVHRIEIVPGGYCSEHIHKHKYNLFFVEKGSLVVEVYQENELIDKTMLTDGEMTTVAPLEKHKFVAVTDVVAYEIYWTQLDVMDILRFSQGGLLNNKTKKEQK